MVGSTALMREPIYMPWYERRRRRRRARVLAGVLTIAVVGGIVGYRTLAGSQGQPAHAAPPPPSAVREVARTVHVSMGDGELRPKKLLLERGEPVRMVVHPVGRQFHDLYLDALDIHLHLWPGDEVTVRLRPMERGTFTGGCLVEGHEKETFTVVVR